MGIPFFSDVAKGGSSGETFLKEDPVTPTEIFEMYKYSISGLQNPLGPSRILQKSMQPPAGSQHPYESLVHLRLLYATSLGRSLTK